MILNDFEILENGIYCFVEAPTAEQKQTLFAYMKNHFKDEWANDCREYYEKKKQKKENAISKKVQKAIADIDETLELLD